MSSLAWGVWAQGLLDLGQGRMEAALDQLEAGMTGTVRHQLTTTLFMPDLVEAAVRCYQPERARAPLARFGQWATATGRPWARAVALRCRALTAVREEETESHYVEAIRLHLNGGRPFEQARTRLAFGEWQRRRRREADARIHLRQALETFERAGAEPWATRARAELRATGDATAAVQGMGAVGLLTPQELQIVRLAARGATNRDIGAQSTQSDDGRCAHANNLVHLHHDHRNYRRPPLPSIHDFVTWEPLLRLLRAGNVKSLAAPGGHVAGRIDRHGWSLPLPPRFPRPGRALQVEDMQDEVDAVERVQSALADVGADGISFAAEIGPTGRTMLYLLTPSPAVEAGIGPHPGSLILVQGSVPEPWRRSPDPVPGVATAPSVDLALLERTLRERIPGATGATEAEIAAAEARLGVALPDELKVLYRVTRGRWQDWGDDYAAAERVFEAVGCELFPLDGLYIADAPSRPCPWRFAATAAAVTPPDAAVQGLVGSPGWIAFGDNGGGDRIAVDLTPGPRGHVGQLIMLDHEQNIGAALLADSLTDLVVNRRRDWHSGRPGDEPPVVARVNIRGLTSVQAAAHPALEVLRIGVWDGEPLSLAPATGLPRLRTLTAYPGTLADPLEITKLTGLEFLELGPEEWRVLLDAGAVPRGLSAAAIDVQGNRHPLPIVAIANELLALWGRPPITRTILQGHLGPIA
ncbi:SMI1/KNR4 family protein [Nonomuraea sp. H19]|uniref:SMI1/KNR4 family protein n=1 Tax=Nonomuraea sp. H19 TaxID=3452206 RepID=UPI003F8C3FF0